MEKLKESTKKWLKQHAEGPRSDWFLAALSFAEAVFFPIPVDLFLIPLILAKRDKWFRFSLITTLFSVLGAIAGYLLGAFFADIIVEPIVNFYSLQEEMVLVIEWFAKGTFIVIFASALTPIPFKVFTLAAGIFGAPFVPFLLASILGRGIRFFAEGILLHKFGKKISEILYKSINKYSLIVLLVLILLILIYFLFK